MFLGGWRGGVQRFLGCGGSLNLMSGDWWADVLWVAWGDWCGVLGAEWESLNGALWFVGAAIRMVELCIYC